MKIQEYGTEHKNAILLLHGGGLSWWNYREAAKLLQGEYHVILPILDGHSGSDRPFTTIEENAAEIISFLDEHVEHGWVDKVNKAKNLVRRGREAADQINILGDDGVPVSYHISFWKSELIDFAFLQQDAFDDIDALTPMERQKFMLDLLLEICDREFEFEDFEQCRSFFKELINDLRQMNYTKFHSEEFEQYNQTITKLLEEYGK